MNVPEDLLYAETHEWVRVHDGIGTVGITDHAQNELTDIVFVDPPKTGTTVKAGQPAAVVESVKAASDIYSPVDGEVVEVNGELEGEPALLNTDPYGRGWICKLRLADPAQLTSLKSPADYAAQIG